MLYGLSAADESRSLISHYAITSGRMGARTAQSIFLAVLSEYIAYLHGKLPKLGRIYALLVTWQHGVSRRRRLSQLQPGSLLLALVLVLVLAPFSPCPVLVCVVGVSLGTPTPCFVLVCVVVVSIDPYGNGQ